MQLRAMAMAMAKWVLPVPVPPTSTELRCWAMKPPPGGLISGSDPITDYRRAAGYVDRILKCQRRSKNASAGRSKNTSTMLASRAPNWGPSSDIRLGRDYPPVCPSWHGVSGSCSD